MALTHVRREGNLGQPSLGYWGEGTGICSVTRSLINPLPLPRFCPLPWIHSQASLLSSETQRPLFSRLDVLGPPCVVLVSFLSVCSSLALTPLVMGKQILHWRQDGAQGSKVWIPALLSPQCALVTRHWLSKPQCPRLWNGIHNAHPIGFFEKENRSSSYCTYHSRSDPRSIQKWGWGQQRAASSHVAPQPVGSTDTYRWASSRVSGFSVLYMCLL